MVLSRSSAWLRGLAIALALASDGTAFAQQPMAWRIADAVARAVVRCDACRAVGRWPENVAVTFKALAESAFEIESMAWFVVPSWRDFQRCRQEVLLRFLQVVEEAGTAFAFPARTVHIAGVPST
ncbi:hypothetical protein BH11PSE8_BH11PSE8_20700 [soil metagenome]